MFHSPWPNRRSAAATFILSITAVGGQRTIRAGAKVGKTGGQGPRVQFVIVSGNHQLYRFQVHIHIGSGALDCRGCWDTSLPLNLPDCNRLPGRRKGLHSGEIKRAILDSPRIGCNYTAKGSGAYPLVSPWNQIPKFIAG